MSGGKNLLFRIIVGLTGVSEMIIGIAIVFFATKLQSYLAPGVLYEPLNLRILGAMDLFIGTLYVLISARPDHYCLLNKSTAYLRLGLSALFFAEGFFLLEAGGLRTIYRLLAFFDFFLFAVQFIYLKKAK